MMHAAEVCPCCGRSDDGAYWVIPEGWMRIGVLPKMKPDELVDYLAARRLLEKRNGPRHLTRPAEGGTF